MPWLPRFLLCYRRSVADIYVVFSPDLCYHGDMTRKAIPIAERFWKRVEKTDTCWIWTGAKTHGGYGVIQSGRRPSKIIRTHRLSYELCNGPIADGLDVCHSCDNPSCVNPSHLFLGTRSDNMRDCVAKGRLTAPSTCFSRGENHPRSKLTADQVRAIRIEYESGKTSTRKLAEKYAISRRSIMFIIHRKQWTHI